MKKSISVNKKSRGRPKKKGGVYPVTAVRLSPALGTEVDKWAGSQPDTPTRSEAIRRLVELGLKVKTPARPVEERAERRRRLTKGPTEFREARVDQPKAKK